MHQSNLFPQEQGRLDWEPTRQAGLQRLSAFLPHAGRSYAQRRNFDLGAGRHEHVSTLSPWLRNRLVLEQDVLGSVLRRHSLRGAEKFVQEVFWRGYFKGWLEHHPEIWSRYLDGLGEAQARLDADPALQRDHMAAIQGQTGIECFDAWARELVQTGYLHNHARMWFASIWIFTLRLPWELGAAFFLHHLLDGDPASNTLSWRWVGGLHTRGKHYLARAENIARLTEGRFTPTGLNESAAPLPEDAPAQPVKWSAPAPLPREGRIGLLVTREDCQPDSLALPHRPVAMLGVASEPSGTSDRSARFEQDSLRDALRYGGRAFDCPTALEISADWVDTMLVWAQSHRLDHVVTSFAPRGPVQMALRQLRGALDRAGVGLFQVQRPYDQMVWPHAGKGFFKLKRQIPEMIARLPFL